MSRSPDHYIAQFKHSLSKKRTTGEHRSILENRIPYDDDRIIICIMHSFPNKMYVCFLQGEDKLMKKRKDGSTSQTQTAEPTRTVGNETTKDSPRAKEMNLSAQNIHAFRNPKSIQQCFEVYRYACILFSGAYYCLSITSLGFRWRPRPVPNKTEPMLVSPLDV